MSRATRQALAALTSVLLIPACGSSPPPPPPIQLTPSEMTFTGSVAGPNPPAQQAALRNLTPFLRTLDWTGTADKPWLQLSPAFGTTGFETDELTVSVVRQQTEAWTSDLPLAGAPAAAMDFSMVWTGSEILIWGGAVGPGPTLTAQGFRFDPAADAWTGMLSATGAPAARWGHTGVWTGSEMILWGGSDSAGTRLNTGYRYQPATDTWIGPISAVGAPAARRAHTAVWTGTEMIIWGGEVSGVPVNDGARYDPSTDTWTPVTMTAAPTIRWHHAAVWTGDEMIVWGGYDGFNGVDTGKRYSPTTDSWGAATSTTGTPPGKMTASAVWTGQEMIVFGGQTTQGSPGSDTGGRYDPASDAWQATTTTNAPAIRFGAEGVWTGKDMILWGGGLNTGKRYLPSIALPVGTHRAVLTVRDPGAANSPQHLPVTFLVTP